MANPPSSESKDKTSELPAPEVLKPQVDVDSEPPAPEPEATAAPSKSKVPKRPRHVTYRPSHKATFTGLAALVGILALNVGVASFFMRGQVHADAEARQGEVTISSEALDKLGVSRTAVGNLGTELIVGPNSRFNGKVTVGSDLDVAGGLNLNSKLSAADASLTKLQAGNTLLQKLSVNGDGTISNLNLRKDLGVVGTTRLQGPVTVSQLLTVNNNVSIAGSLSVGGSLSASRFRVSGLTVGGHIITRGSAPAVGRGPAIGSNGTISISGNDASGTVAVNIGSGAGGGTVAHVAFHSQYGNIPHVVVTAVGRSAGDVYVTRTAGGFSIGVGGPLSPGGYAFDYIVME